MKTIRIKQQCQACDGTGVYVGCAERGRIGVVCHQCDGSGEQEFVHEYETFTGRKRRKDVEHIVERNVGICIGRGNGLEYKDFGGMPYSEWLITGKFPPKSENRKFTCPFWYYRQNGFDDWPCNEINLPGNYHSDCPRFKCKEECWKRYDRERGQYT